MNLIPYVILVAIVLVIVWAVMLYNGLVALKHNVSQSWSNIDVLVKQRHDELPKLVETCKQHMQYEADTLQQVMEARNAAQTAGNNADPEAMGLAETAMRSGLGRLFAVAEDYPELKANESFQNLQMRISGLENSIADRREFYNASVNVYNVRIEQFPDNLVARQFAFTPKKLLEFEASELTDVNVKTLFNT